MPENSTIAGKYRLGRRIGQGSFGKCYIGTDLESGREVALKLEPTRAKNPQLLAEAKLYQRLAGGLGMPAVHWSGTEGEHNVMAMDLLGLSLEDLFKDSSKRFSLKTTVMLGDQMINRLEYMHSKCSIHRDVKPDNFVMGLGCQAHLVYIIDFGLAKRYRNQKTLQHHAYGEKSSLTGTARYASINTHLNIEQSRRDDLESVAYVLLYFIRGGLPWQGLKANSKKEKYQKILERKMSMPIQQMCGSAPAEFGTFLQYCRKLKFEEQPDYNFLRRLLRGTLQRFKLQYDLRFDWSSSAPAALTGVAASAPSSSRFADDGSSASDAEKEHGTPRSGHGTSRSGIK